MNGLKIIQKIPIIKKYVATQFKPKNPTPCSIFNLQFLNKVGLAAGFDKNAAYLSELENIGFGFVEIGTVTPQPQVGNEKPRLFRLPVDKAIINRMGFNNDGVDKVVENIKRFNNLSPQSTLIIGGNIGKNKLTPNEDAWKDYETCFTALHNWVNYFVVNVSSPNTPGLRELQEKDSLKKIITNLQKINCTQKIPKPILLKIAPDLTVEQLDDVIDLALEIKLDGLVVANTTISREELLTPNKRVDAMGAGGLSGLPLKNTSTNMVKYIYQKTAGQIPIIASGGIFTGNDAKEKILAGASLVQVWTGFIYQGPSIIKNICKDI